MRRFRYPDPLEPPPPRRIPASPSPRYVTKEGSASAGVPRPSTDPSRVGSSDDASMRVPLRGR
jgi:hypothetical protein